MYCLFSPLFALDEHGPKVLAAIENELEEKGRNYLRGYSGPSRVSHCVMSIPTLFCPDLFSSAFLLEISSLRACPFSLAEAGHVTNFQQFLRLKNLNSRQQLYFLKSEVQPGIDPKLSY